MAYANIVKLTFSCYNLKECIEFPKTLIIWETQQTRTLINEKKSFTAKDLTTFTTSLNIHKFKLKSSITSKHLSYHVHFIIKQTSDDVHLN